MKVLLQRISNDRHRMVAVRADGSRIEAEFETRSVLLHDLVHYAVEAEAGIADGFWGLLAAGKYFDELPAWEATGNDGIKLAESLVGPMQSVWTGKATAERYVELAGKSAPFVDIAFVERVQERIRRLWGQWRATPFQETMELSWPAEPIDVDAS